MDDSYFGFFLKIPMVHIVKSQKSNVVALFKTYYRRHVTTNLRQENITLNSIYAFVQFSPYACCNFRP
jgi:hypothetical protein